MSDREITLSSTRSWIISGIVIIGLMFGGMGSWAYYAQITGAVIASGTVGVESRIKTVQHLSGGIISQILVREGDNVISGELLLRLDETVIRANLTVTNGELLDYRAQKQRLIAERDQTGSVNFGPELLNHPASDNLQQILNNQLALFATRRNSLENEHLLLEQQAEQYAQVINGLKAQHEAKTEQSGLITEEIDSLLPLLKKRLIPKTRILVLRREKARIHGEAGQLIAEIAKTHGTIRETGLRALKSKVAFREKVLSELDQVQLKIIELQERYITLADQYKHLDIRAPQTGRIHKLSVHTLGGVVTPGMEIVQIVPYQDRLIIEARIATNDIDQIYLNQNARIQFSAFDSRTTPQLDASIIRISADTLIDKTTGTSYFAVDLALKTGQIERLTGNVLVSGMSADVFIRTVDRTVLHILLKPLTDQLSRAFKAG